MNSFTKPFLSALSLRSRSLSTKLSLVILLLAAPIFLLSMGMLFTQSRNIIRKEAVGHANSVLNTTMQRMRNVLGAVETATDAYCWLISENLQPDSLLKFTRLVVALNSSIDGCSISMEPYAFPKYGRYFSAYTIRQGDSIITTIEEPYEYFNRVWYKLPHDLNGTCWVDFYDDADSLYVYLPNMIASYGKPIYDAKGKLAAIISTDVTLGHLHNVVNPANDSTTSQVNPYRHSYMMMIDGEGRYIIHPDSARMFKQTIFSGADPRQQSDLIVLGHEMTKGKSGSMGVMIDGEPCLVVYQPVPGTSWSMAFVCSDNDILADYHKLTYILLPLVVFGILFILLLCHHVVAKAISPLNQLLVKTQSIAAGNMEVYIPRSKREDAVGRLQNSFASMLQRLNFHMGIVRYTSDQAQRHNDELAKATRMAEGADRQKTIFMQNVTHQIRTPLNSIMGFAQVLGGKEDESLSNEELKNISGIMDYNSKLLNRLVLMLFDSSDIGLSEELENLTGDQVACNDVARECISYVKMHYPNVNIRLQSEVADDFCLQTSRLYLLRSLREMLYNSAKYSDQQHIVLRIFIDDGFLNFIIEDTGKGVDPADLKHIFTFFGKGDDLSEGLGLGLPLAKRHIDNLGGTLTIDEDYHDGARFIIRLPLTRGE